MNLVLLGPPGSGKGTQAKRIEQSYGLVQLATGDMVRAAIASGSELGRRVKVIYDAGRLVPDEDIIAMIAERIAAPEAQRGVILDGFPRTLPQAEALDRMLAEHGRELDHAILIEVDEATLIDRIAGRFSCRCCGALYHERSHPPKVEGECDTCGATEFVHRPDDRAEVVATRFAAYRRQTEPLLPYYRERSLLRRVDGVAEIDQVTHDIEAILGPKPRQT